MKLQRHVKTTGVTISIPIEQYNVFKRTLENTAFPKTAVIQEDETEFSLKLLKSLGDMWDDPLTVSPFDLGMKIKLDRY